MRSKWIYNPAFGAILLLLSAGLDRTLPAQAGGHQKPVTANTSDSPDSNPATATFITFDVPGAATMVPDCINDGGTATGNYMDGNLVSHGFLRCDAPALSPMSGASRWATKADAKRSSRLRTCALIATFRCGALAR
jgi:hypothetical protein